jgi:hypothetical protein
MASAGWRRPGPHYKQYFRAGTRSIAAGELFRAAGFKPALLGILDS